MHAKNNPASYTGPLATYPTDLLTETTSHLVINSATCFNTGYVKQQTERLSRGHGAVELSVKRVGDDNWALPQLALALGAKVPVSHRPTSEFAL